MSASSKNHHQSSTFSRADLPEPVQTALREVARMPVGGAAFSRPISPRQHGLIDYVQASMLMAAPTVFGLTGTTASLTRSFGIMQMMTNLFSDHPVALQRIIPFRAHGVLEKWTGPLFAAAALLTGASRRPQNLIFLAGQTLLTTVIFNLTDWNRNPNK